jgi:hypothetical protein
MKAKPYNLCSHCGYLIGDNPTFEITDVRILDIPEAIIVTDNIMLWTYHRGIFTLGFRRRILNHSIPIPNDDDHIIPQNAIEAFLAGIDCYNEGPITYEVKKLDRTGLELSIRDDVADIVNERLYKAARTLATLPIMKGNTVTKKNLEDLPGCQLKNYIRGYYVQITPSFKDDSHSSLCTITIKGEKHRLSDYTKCISSSHFEFEVPIAEIDLKKLKHKR